MGSRLIRPRAVHIKLSKETHANLRTRLFGYELSMQDAFEEFAAMVGAGDTSAIRIVERLATRLAKESLKDAPSSALRPTSRPKAFDEQDHDVLYSLIEDDDGDNDPGGRHGNRAA